MPYHMIGAASMESAILGQYADYVRQCIPRPRFPAFTWPRALFEDASRLRAAMGDEAFFAQLSQEQAAAAAGAVSAAVGMPTSFEAAMQAPPEVGGAHPPGRRPDRRVLQSATATWRPAGSEALCRSGRGPGDHVAARQGAGL